MSIFPKTSGERIRIGEAITLEFPPGEIGFLRCLVDPSQSPGDVEWSCAVVIDENKKCTLNIFNGKRVPNRKEIRAMKKFFFGHGCDGEWNRNHNGKPPKKILVKGK